LVVCAKTANCLRQVLARLKPEPRVEKREPRELFQLSKPEQLTAREVNGDWQLSEDGLLVRGADQRSTTLALNGVALPARFRLEANVSLSKDDSRLPALFGIEFDTGADRPVWLLTIQNSSGSVILYELSATSKQWQAVASTAPGFVSPASAAIGIPVVMSGDGTRLEVTVNQARAFTYTLAKSAQGGRVSLRAQGAQVLVPSLKVLEAP
jgi:hypothetical protein